MLLLLLLPLTNSIVFDCMNLRFIFLFLLTYIFKRLRRQLHSSMSFVYLCIHKNNNVNSITLGTSFLKCRNYYYKLIFLKNRLAFVDSYICLLHPSSIY